MAVGAGALPGTPDDVFGKDNAMMMHRKDDRHAFIRMEYKRFLDTVIRTPAMVIVRACAIVIRLVVYTVSLDGFFSAWATTERARFG